MAANPHPRPPRRSRLHLPVCAAAGLLDGQGVVGLRPGAFPCRCCRWLLWDAGPPRSPGQKPRCFMVLPLPPPPPPQIPAFAGYMLCVHVVIPWWQNPKFNDMPETGAVSLAAGVHAACGRGRAVGSSRRATGWQRRRAWSTHRPPPACPAACRDRAQAAREAGAAGGSCRQVPSLSWWRLPVAAVLVPCWVPACSPCLPPSCLLAVVRCSHRHALI